MVAPRAEHRRRGGAAEQEQAAKGFVRLHSAKAIPFIGELFVTACEEPRERKKHLLWTFEALLALGGPKAAGAAGVWEDEGSQCPRPMALHAPSDNIQGVSGG